MKLSNFFKTKFSAFAARNLSAEESITRATDLIITQITTLSERYHTANAEISKLEASIREEKQNLAEREEKVIFAQKKNLPNVKELAQIALTNKKIIVNKENRKAQLEQMVVTITDAGKELRSQYDILKSKLELVKENERARGMGINTESDVEEMVGLTDTEVKDIMMRVDAFKGIGSDLSSADDIDVERYLETLKNK